MTAAGTEPGLALTGTTLALTGEVDGGVRAVWGRGSVSSFDGRDGSLTLDGKVESAMLGGDFAAGGVAGGSWWPTAAVTAAMGAWPTRVMSSRHSQASTPRGAGRPAHGVGCRRIWRGDAQADARRLVAGRAGPSGRTGCPNWRQAANSCQRAAGGCLRNCSCNQRRHHRRGRSAGDRALEPARGHVAPRGAESAPDNLGILRARGDSMEPFVGKGDRLIVDVSRRRPASGEMAGLWDRLGLVIKRAVAGSGSGPAEHRLISANPVYAPCTVPAQNVHMVGKVVRVLRKA